MLDSLMKKGLDVFSIGKIQDIFAGRGITKAFPTSGNTEGIRITLEPVSYTHLDVYKRQAILPPNPDNDGNQHNQYDREAEDGFLWIDPAVSFFQSVPPFLKADIFGEDPVCSSLRRRKEGDT